VNSRGNETEKNGKNGLAMMSYRKLPTSHSPLGVVAKVNLCHNVWELRHTWSNRFGEHTEKKIKLFSCVQNNWFAPRKTRGANVQNSIAAPWNSLLKP
jgi:hypothetical protein